MYVFVRLSIKNRRKITKIVKRIQKNTMINIEFRPEVDINDPISINKALETIEKLKIDKCNWPDKFPYAPEVTLQMIHTGDAFILKYEVREKCTAARVTTDKGRTWTDSCVECFFQPYGKGKYYNLECTCIGKIIMNHREGRPNPTICEQEVLDTIKRYPSLGTEPFEEIIGDNHWTVILVIPKEAYWEDDIKTFRGMDARLNAYKCGDELSTPHFLSLAPVGTEKPDFHRPEYFTAVHFND